MNVKVQCAYCIRNRQHGGECNGKQDLKSCTLFKQDSRGCIRNTDTRLEIPLFFQITPLNVWSNDWEIKGHDTEVKINRIYGLDWDKTKGLLRLHCNIDYYINDLEENEDKPISKVIFKVIDGGGK